MQANVVFKKKPVAPEGGLSDVDERTGDERKLAIESPVKNGRRIDSSVSY